MFVEYNPNPSGKRANDCVIRAICKAMDMDWKTVYMKLCMKGLELKDWPANFRTSSRRSSPCKEVAS